MNINLDDLKAKAEAATQDHEGLTKTVVWATFVAAATPEAVLQLIAEIERLQWIINEADRAIETSIYLAKQDGKGIQEGDLRDVQEILRDDARGDE